MFCRSSPRGSTDQMCDVGEAVKARPAARVSLWVAHASTTLLLWMCIVVLLAAAFGGRQSGMCFSKHIYCWRTFFVVLMNWAIFSLSFVSCSRTWRIWERLGFWISKPCLFGLAKEGLLSFFCNAMNISEFLHWFQSMFNFFPHICDWCPDIHSHGSDFVFWTLLFHWFGTCICSFRLLARWMNRYVGPMHFILPAWIYVYYLMMLLILGKNFCKELSFLEIWATYEFVVIFYD